MGTQMPDQATTTEQEAQGQAVADELIDSFGDPIDNFGEPPPETTPVEPAAATPAVEPAPEPSTVQPAAGDAIPPAVAPATPGSGEGAPPAQPGAQSPVSFPDELLTLSGLSEQQAREVFGTPDKLLQAMSDFDRRMFDAGRQLVAGGPPVRPTPPVPAPPQPATTPPVATPPPQPAAPAPATKPPLVEPFKLEEPEEWDATTRKLVEDMNAHWAKQIEKHAQQVMQVQQLLIGTLEMERQRAEQEYVNRFDQMCESLGEDWADVLGKGSGRKLDPRSTEYQNRVKLDQAMMAVAGAMRQAGHRPLAQDQLFKRSLQFAFPDKFEATIRARLLGQALQRQAQFTIPPTGRTGKAMTPDERAQAAVRKFLADRGEPVPTLEEGPDEV